MYAGDEPSRGRHRAGASRPCETQHDQVGAVAAYSRDRAAWPRLFDSARRELGGLDLACWCRLESRLCYADVLLLVVVGSTPLDAYAIGAGDRDPH